MHDPMSQAEQDPIAGWLSRHYETTEAGHRPEVVDLFHVNSGDNNVRLDRYQIAVHTADGARRMAATVRFRARADAEDRGHHERYSIALHWPTDARVEPMFYTFGVDGMQIRTSQVDTPTEPANLTGVTKQLMRHNEALIKVALGQAERNQQHAQEREEMLVRRLNQMESDRVRVVEMQEQLMSRQLERDIERTRAENAEARKDAALNEALPLLKMLPPKLIEAVSSKGGKDEGAAVTPMMRMLFESLSIDQLKAMAATMPPEQQVHFLQLYRLVMNLPKDEGAPADHADAEAQAEETPDKNPEDDTPPH